jgi:hypothetical protein
MADFRMDKTKPINNNGSQHSMGEYDYYDPVTQTSRVKREVQDESIVKAIPTRPMKPNG